MNNNNVLEEFFVWEEKNLIDQNQNLLKNAEKDKCVTTIETKTDSIPKDWRDITDPKLRKRMCSRARYEANKDEIKLSKKRYYEVNKEQINLQRKAYREINKEKVRLQDRMRDGKKRQTNINFKLSKGLRTRLWSAIKDNQKAGSAVKDLGCSVEELKQYLESKFQPEMSWDNWSLDGWHIDHIKPLSSFDLTDRKQMLEACHYTNLQPLWAKDNLSKSDKISNN
jgi:hypothetical protein